MRWHGSLLDKTTTRSKREQTKFPDFLRKIRQCPCLICGKEAEAAHLRMSSAEYGKVNSRNDKFVTPLCPGHHRLYPDAQHNFGEQDWWDSKGINPLPIAKALWDARDNLEKMQAIAASQAKFNK